MLWVALAIFLFSYNFSRTLFTLKKIYKEQHINKLPFIMGAFTFTISISLLNKHLFSTIEKDFNILTYN